MLQARQLGKELYVGVHSDEEILENKGPVVMKLDERMTAVNACKWSTEAIARAPYVTDPKFMEEHGCKYVVHGDDITTDANGEDCYKTVKDMGLFVVVKRTPNISTTDLVGRMLLMSKTHHFRPIVDAALVLDHALFAEDALTRFGNYALDETGRASHSAVYVNVDAAPALTCVIEGSEKVKTMLQRSIVYVDGGFDLFNPGQIEALRLVREEANRTGSAVVVGLHDDKTVNQYKGLNYPIMNLFERSLCVLQCKYVDSVVIGAPYEPSKQFLNKLPGPVVTIFHGPTPVDEGVYDEVLDLLKQLPAHKFDDMNTEFIVNRVLENKAAYEERQRKKGWKGEIEKKIRDEELLRAAKLKKQ
ncbi:hypothetical protein PUMCH_000568 [Australozyma saopauloensis]|uniref:ethanolamine-phosphate cytidylyltransferase n=1 Tax=Australozyma saopauloensis TaxID=291208 RepID=A0AAX4H4A5_9ASCO|nr:hypothetical protein PUMCH_000568 [[Candida] saopauloensis]